MQVGEIFEEYLLLDYKVKSEVYVNVISGRVFSEVAD